MYICYDTKNKYLERNTPFLKSIIRAFHGFSDRIKNGLEQKCTMIGNRDTAFAAAIIHFFSNPFFLCSIIRASTYEKKNQKESTNLHLLDPNFVFWFDLGGHPIPPASSFSNPLNILNRPGATTTSPLKRRE